MQNPAPRPRCRPQDPSLPGRPSPPLSHWARGPRGSHRRRGSLQARLSTLCDRRPAPAPSYWRKAGRALGTWELGEQEGEAPRLRLRPWGLRPAGRKLEGLRGQRPGGVALTQALWSSLTSLFFLVMVLRKRPCRKAQQRRDQLRGQDRVQGTAPRGALPGAGRRSGQALLLHLRGRGPLTPGPALWPRRKLKPKREGTAGLPRDPPSLQTCRGTLPRLRPSLQHCFPPSLSNERLQAWPDGPQVPSPSSRGAQPRWAALGPQPPRAGSAAQLPRQPSPVLRSERGPPAVHLHSTRDPSCGFCHAPPK